MIVVNVWLALRDDVHALIHERVTWDEADRGPYTGSVTDRKFKVFGTIGDIGAQNQWRVDADVGRQWTIWSVNLTAPASARRLEIDALLGTLPPATRTMGAWWVDGRQVGTEWELDGDGLRTGNTTGTPTYPIHARILESLHDIVTYDGFGNELSRVRPTDLSTANVLFGQSVRRM